MIDSLADWVRVLEGRVLRRLSCSSCSSRPSTGSLYGNPGESVHQTVEEPERLEGMVGDGSRNCLYTHIIVNQIEDLDNLDL